ncbi:MAG: GSCFA domain-containing protein, partial [Bacteroidales bacterium]|nr:GSCFA domain-containing protein [Bacteroidales bacterium]
MELRTIVNTGPSSERIDYSTGVMLVGSCFATEIGMKMRSGRMPVMINPSGTVYNPVSVSKTLELAIENRKFQQEDLYDNDGTWLSFHHYTEFSAGSPERVLEKINRRTEEAHEFIRSAKFLFLTFGTARVYRWKPTGMIVSNCHKIPSASFDQELLSVNDIVSLWKNQLDTLHAFSPGLKVVFTVSPIRHWKDGAHGNQVSKSTLILAVEELLDYPAVYSYFPAYEIVMDDLRDYRFYAADMLHLSETAIDYVWNAFSGSFITREALDIRKEVDRITKAVGHRLPEDSNSDIKKFAERILTRIEAVSKKMPSIDLEREKIYFS